MKQQRRKIIQDVLAFYRQGHGKAWIAREIGISRPTVHSYISRFANQTIKFGAVGRPKIARRK